jgi:tetratricopeptide (TPR) repeat protein
MADRALARDPDHLEARVVKALAYTRLERHEEAKALVDEVMEATGFEHPQALKLYAEYKFRRAGHQQMAAFAHRTPTYSSSTRTEWRGDGLWEVTTTTRHDPSSADLARADALVAAAAANLREAELAMQKAVELTRGTLDGYLLEADYEHWYRSRERAGQLLAEAVGRYPDSLAARDKLAWWFRWMGADDKAVEAESNALRLVHDTAGPSLGKVWNRRPPLGTPAMIADLSTARSLDYADARIPAYLGALHDHAGRTAEAAAHYRTALALEGARLDRDRALLESGPPAPRPIREFALAAAMRIRLGRIAEAAGDRAQALVWYGGNAGIENLAAPGWQAAPLFEAMLPNPDAPSIPVPRPDHGATLIARSYLEAARILRALGRPDEALRYFEQAASYGPPLDRRAPNIGTGRPDDNNFTQFAGAPAAEAHFELARHWMEQGDANRAQRHIGAASHQDISQDMRRQLNEIQMQLARVYRERDERAWQQQQAQQQAAYEAQVAAGQDLARRQADMQRSGAPLDPQIEGLWITPAEHATDRMPGVPERVALTLRIDGSYAMEQQTNGTAEHTTGAVTAWDSRITLSPAGASPIEGFYRVQPGMSFNPNHQSPTQLQLVLGNLQLTLERQDAGPR